MAYGHLVLGNCQAFAERSIMTDLARRFALQATGDGRLYGCP